MKTWIIAGAVLLAGSLLYLVAAPGSSKSTTQFNQLQQRDREKEREQQAIVVRHAIPELPELFDWENTRVWNLPLNNPAIAQRRDADFLRPEDTVCGVLLGDHARAYPWFVLSNYHAINDHIDGQPVIVTLCEACNGGAAFLAHAANTTLDFRPCGLKNGTWYAVDFQTGSHWYPFIGEAFRGPLKGTKLERVRLYFSTWRDWAREHPETTVVLSNQEVRQRPHGILGHMASDVNFNPDLLPRIISPEPNAKRDLLVAHELVFGLIPSDDSPARAYRLEQLQQAESPIQTQFCGVPLVLFVQNQYQVGAYQRRCKGVELELSVASDEPLLMADQLGNTWNAWGRTVSGPNHPSELRLADGYLAKWYEWIENFPRTELADRQ